MALIPTTTGPQQDHLKILSDFFGGADGESSPLDVLKNLSDNGGGGADIRAGIDARRQQEGELSDRLAADPRNLRLQMLSKQMGIEDAADPDSDLNVQASRLADTQAQQGAARSLLPGVRAAKAQSMADAGTQAQDVARGTATGTAEGQYSVPGQAVADAASKRKIAEEIAPTQAMFGGAGGGSGDQIDNLAAAYQKDPSFLSQVPAHMKDAVVARASQGTINPALSNQTKQMAEGSKIIMNLVPQAESAVQQLHDSGLFGLGIGSLRQFAAAHGASSLIGDHDTAQKISYVNSLVDSMKKEYARSIAGARGAGNSGLAAAFDKLIPLQGDYDSFVGGLNGVKAALAANIAGPNAVPAADPYSDPNYQPK